MSFLSSFPQTKVTLVRQDGSRKEFEAHVQSSLVMTVDTSLVVEPGDEVERRLPSGQVEVLEIRDPGFTAAIGSFPDHFQMKVVRKGSRRPVQTSITAGVVVQGNVNGGNIAGGNMTITTTITQNNLKEIADFIGSVKSQLSLLNLSTEEKEELVADLASLEIQIKKKDPKPTMIAQLFQTVRSQLIKHAATATTTFLLTQANQIWPILELHLPRLHM